MSKSNSKPTHTASVKIGQGEDARFETVGIAWLNSDGKIALKVYGTQIINGTIYINPIPE